MVGADREKILDRLPYVGLDIEGLDRESVRVEYSPNRPDFGTDFGVARALRGLLGKEVGLPHYPTSDSAVTISVDNRLSKVRPFIACATASGLRLDEEDVRQIISLQEDLHNGLGRRRKTAAIGLHDMDAVKPPLAYRAVGPGFRFAPLGAKKESTMAEVLEKTKEGKAYGPILRHAKAFPVITDSEGKVLSFPPVINGNATKVTAKTRNIFIDVTSTDMTVGDDILAIVATTLAEAGAKLGTVSVAYPHGSRITPDLAPVQLPLDLNLIRSLLGLDMTSKQVTESLGRSRMSVRGKVALGPRYRVDLLHPVDVAEEVALGFGIDRIAPLYPPSGRPGAFNAFEEFLDSTATVMAGSGMIELMTYELTDAKSLYSNFGRSTEHKVSVHDPRSAEHSMLRDALVPSLAASLSGNVKSDYPQRIFEIGRVFTRTGGGVAEAWHLGCLIAHSQASFSEAKMHLEAACRTLSGQAMTTAAADHWAYARGRSAAVHLGSSALGFVGELKPESIDALGVKVPVSGFEIDLSAFYERLK
jgi:phenylalanyl-tRNA synthetase beta chain